MRAVIVDDEKKSQNALSKMLTRYCPEVEVCGFAGNVQEAIDLNKQIIPDIIFLDIRMPGGSGFDLIESVDITYSSVIFTTAYSEYAIDAIRAHAVDYLLKPINIGDLQDAVQRVSNRDRNKNKNAEASNQQIQNLLKDINPGSWTRISIPSMNGIDLICASDIVRCEAQGSYTHFHLLDGRELIASKNIKTFEEKLLSCDFFRVHKSHLINLKHTIQYVRGEGGFVNMRDGSHINVSKRRRAELAKKLGC